MKRSITLFSLIWLFGIACSPSDQNNTTPISIEEIPKNTATFFGPILYNPSSLSMEESLSYTRTDEYLPLLTAMSDNQPSKGVDYETAKVNMFAIVSEVSQQNDVYGTVAEVHAIGHLIHYYLVETDWELIDPTLDADLEEYVDVLLTEVPQSTMLLLPALARLQNQWGQDKMGSAAEKILAAAQIEMEHQKEIRRLEKEFVGGREDKMGILPEFDQQLAVQESQIEFLEKWIAGM